MRIIAAYLLAVLGGNANPDEKAVKKILDACDIKAEASRITELVEKLKGKDLDALIAEGKAKVGASAPAAGGDEETSSGGGGGKPAGKAEAGKKGGKVKEPEPEPEPAEDEDSGMAGLFD